MNGGDPLRRELDEHLAAELSHLRGTLLVDAGDRPTVPALDLTRGAVTGEILERFGARYPGGDPRAVASLWSQWYFGALVPGAVVLGVLGERILPLALEEVELIVDEETARPTGFRLPDGGTTAPGADVFRRFEPLVWGHLAPFVEAFAAETGLGEGTLWCNAGRPLQWILDEIESRNEGSGAAVTDVRDALLGLERWPDGRPNALSGTVGYVEEAGDRRPRRRICCLRYLLPGVAGCGSLCPLPDVRAGGNDAG